MNKILEKKQLCEKVFLMVIEAEDISENALPGEFLIVKNGEFGERIPLTICDYDAKAKTVTIVFQVVGASTLELSNAKVGDSFDTVAGPLGCPSEFVKEDLTDKKIALIAGGVGIAPIFIQAKYLFMRGNRPDILIGARTKELLFLVDELKEYGQVYLATDDGSCGLKGNTCDLLEKRIQDGARYDKAVAIGPMIMMKYVSMLTKKLEIPTVVSLNPIMVDGTGMCGACRVLVDNQVKFACVDGPEFDAHKVDFD